VPDHPGLRIQHDGPVLSVTLANPEMRNAQTPSLWLALAEVGESLPTEVRVVVIRGEGASFSAGLHRQMLAPGGLPGEADILALATADEGLDETIAGFQRGFTVWRSVPAVVVAVVQGQAVGAGFQLALAADLRLLADDAQLSMREVRLGLIPDLGGTGPLVHLVGYAGRSRSARPAGSSGPRRRPRSDWRRRSYRAPTCRPRRTTWWRRCWRHPTARSRP
jgi:enoyl-CoA hydratase/carnithine racemase